RILKLARTTSFLGFRKRTEEVEFIGLGTVWRTFPGFKRCGTELESLLCDMEKWAEHHEIQVIDLDQEFWKDIKQAAEESMWIPKDYFMNYWVSDVCHYLRYGGTLAPPTDKPKGWRQKDWEAEQQLARQLADDARED